MEQEYLALVFFPAEKLESMVELLEDFGLFWKYENVSGDGRPSLDLLHRIAPLEQLLCFELRGKVDLVPELVSFMKRDKDASTLDGLGLNLMERGIRAAIGITRKEGHQKWIELRSLYGTFLKMERFFDPRWGESRVFPNVGIFLRSSLCDAP
jgi:hypothetical protein